MGHVSKESIELSRESWWLWLSFDIPAVFMHIPEASGHWQTQNFVPSNPFHLSFPKCTHRWDLLCTQKAQLNADGHQVWEISFLDVSTSPGLVLSFCSHLTPCFSSYASQCVAFIANFVSSGCEPKFQCPGANSVILITKALAGVLFWGVPRAVSWGLMRERCCALMLLISTLAL